jgi:hypothetical protein
MVAPHCANSSHRCLPRVVSCVMMLSALTLPALLVACARDDVAAKADSGARTDAGAKTDVGADFSRHETLRDPPSSELSFRRSLLDRGIDVSTMTSAQGVPAMLDFYDAAKFNVLKDGDVIRVTWHTQTARSVLTVFRDLTWTAGNADDRVERWALWLKYEFGPTGLLSIPEGDGSHRCSGPHARDDCDAFLTTLPLYRAVSSRSDGDVQVGFDPIEER